MGVTDGTYICGLCGEWMTGCNLCGEAPLLNLTTQRRLEVQAERDAEYELWKQSKSIRDAADKRKSF